jgi:hypothetical protein
VEATLKQVEGLLDWRPELGVLSVYLAIDPADRREPWRIELRKQLDAAVKGEADKHGRKPALAATAKRVYERFAADPPPSGRCQVGFCEVAEKRGRDEWLSVQMHRDRTEIHDRERPHLRPLVELLDDGAPLGVVAVSSERVRLYEWALGRLADLEDWEAVLMVPGWRERKAQSSPDPARVQGSSSSGHDQFDQRLDANRKRFLEQVGGLLAQEAGRHEWRGVVAFGDRNQVDEVGRGARGRVEIELGDDADVISENNHGRLLERIDVVVERLNREREADLVDRAISAALAPEGRGATGIDDIERCLTEGRVEHLLIDADSDARDLAEVEDDLLEQALRTSADFTPVEGEPAEALREHGGVAALLRY